MNGSIREAKDLKPDKLTILTSHKSKFAMQISEKFQTAPQRVEQVQGRFALKNGFTPKKEGTHGC